MTNKSLIIIIILIIVVALGVGVYLYFFHSPASVTNKDGGEEKTEIPITMTFEEQIEQTKKDYPEVIRGVINFLDTKNSLKTIIKTDNGKEYVLWPAQPKSVYESFGAKNNGRVEIQGRYLDTDKIEWGIMKPI